jgi:very-short-patch-repair endonuclease
MSIKLPGTGTARPNQPGGDVAEKLRRSRQRLLDLTLRNRLLNFRPGNPDYRDDLKGHKHVGLKGHIESLWQTLVDDEKQVEIAHLTRDQQSQLAQELRQSENQTTAGTGANLSLASLGHEEWTDVFDSIRGVSQFLQRGNLISLLPDENFRKRLTKIRNEQNTLANSTGDSALFLAIGFLEWCEAPPHPRANEPLFAPLILVHVNLDQKRTEEGGEREFVIHMDADQPQGNPCLAEKLRQDFAIDLPDLDEDETATEYFSRVSRLLRAKKSWKVNPTIALGFFNFARYRLWLDLDPAQWPEGKSPNNHPIVTAVLNGDPLPQSDGIPSDDDVANHQATEDLPVVMDSDSTQYATLLAGQKGVSLVVQGPPGSGKSQTITNLIAVSIAQGKRVLFVAQKLPALQVVRRRLESVELAPFCLPLFSDKARVTEVHKHLGTCARLRENLDWQRPLNNQVVALAQKLNGHAARLREKPAGFSQSACALIQKATALHLMLQEAWGVDWNEDLLNVAVLDIEAPPDWLEKREQTIHQWHRLKTEVGDSWSHWAPLNLGSMDTQTIESVVRQLKQSAADLSDSLAMLPDEFHELPIAKVEQLVGEIGKSRFTVLKDVMPGLLAFLWEAPENATVVARLERDLEEFYRQLNKAQRHLRLTEDNRRYVASRATEALNAVVSVVSPRCSVASAKSSLDELNNLLRSAEDLSAYANLNPAGISAIWQPNSSSPDTAAMTWKHVELLANQNANRELQVPVGAKLVLALYVLEDAARKNEARALAQRLARYHASLVRLNSRVADPAPLWSGIAAGEFEPAIRTLCQHSFGMVKLSGLTAFEQNLLALADLDSRTGSLITAGFCADVLASDILKIGDIPALATLANVPVELLQFPSHGTEEVLLKLVGKPSPVTLLQAFGNAVESYQKRYQSVSDWFSEIQLGQQVESGVLASYHEAARIIGELGLAEQNLESVAQLLEKVEKLQKATQTLIADFKAHFETWPLLQPETVDQITQAKKLFLILVSRPQAPAEVPVAALCVQTNADIVSEAMAESRDIQLFREKNADRVAFRDLPEVHSIPVLRRELRSFTDCWWRWFSGRYHGVRKKIRAFLNSPFPTDSAALTLLDELEAHERRRLAFMAAPVGNVLGGLFRGINTNWTAIEPTLAWIQLLKVSTQSSDVTSFVDSATHNAEGLRDSIKSTEILTQILDQHRRELMVISPLALLTADLPAIKIQDLCTALIRTEKLLNDLAGRITAPVKLKPNATFKELSCRINELEQLQKSAVGLRQHSALADPVVAAGLSPVALAEDAKWLSELHRLKVSPNLVAAILGKKWQPAAHFPLFQAALEFSQQLGQLRELTASQPAPAWLAPEISVSELAGKLSQLIQASSVVRIQASECTFDQHLSLVEIQEALDDVHEIEAATKAFVPWKEILHEDPSMLSDAQITATLDWLGSLRLHGASGTLLQWILTEETDSRLHWWQDVLSRAKELRGRIRKLQDNFILPLHESQSAMTLAAWSSQTADRNARTTSALEIVETHSQSNDYTVHDLAEATAGLRRALELESALQSWHDRLGGDTTRLEVARIQNHRQWTAAARGFAPALANWLAATDTTSRCVTLLATEPKLTDLKAATKLTKESLENFGRVLDEGPFKILSLKGTWRDVESHCEVFITKIPLLPSFAALLRERGTARQLGLVNLLTHAEKCPVSADVVIHTFRGAVAFQQAKSVWEADDELRYFQSSEHERLRRKFQDDDDKQQKTNRRFIMRRLCNSDVTEGSKGRTAGEHTEYALLQHEMGKQRRHLPIRKLVNRAGRAMQDLCPCWMMTPLAVAQFLAPGAINFDVVIMDEASQINPEDAWGAITRGQQLVVVGDQKQMPPSDFFMSALEENESPEEEEEIDGGKSESILDASVASLQSSPLLWHYRSRHETLIAPANSFSYDNRLILFPHPHRSHPELGIRYTPVPDATTTTGKVVNALEAEAVAARVRELVLREYAKAAKDRLTIGVVTMNLYQQDAIMDLLDKLRQEDRRFDLAMTSLASELNEEPLFVRNLENIQGDERDIMILSCTYGPHTPGGTPTQRFGPLNRQGGERRFNVLITRAKWRMEIFSSIRSEQILVDGKQQGVRDFHLFLKYAESGVLADPGIAAGRPADSPFETQVEAVLQRAGFQTERQVGVAGYYIDLAVKHPAHGGLFALGIECDGNTYHSSRAARDRDRLREKVLMERGWKLHRIWSTDWFVNPIQAKKKLLDAVNAACR